MMDGNSESEALKGTNRLREEKRASPEPEQGSSEKKKKRRSRKKKKINEKGAEQNEQPQVCPQPEPLVATPIPSELKPDEEAPLPDPKDTPQGAQPQPEEPSNTEHPELKKKKRVKKKKKKKEKGEEPNEHLGVCLDPPLDMAIPTNLEKKKEAQPEPGPGSPTAPICPKPVIPIDQTIPVDPALSECPKAAPPTGQTIPVDPAIPIDAEQNANKKKRKRRKSVVDGAQPNEHEIKSTCHIAAAPIDATFPMEAHPAIPISVAIPADPGHNTSEKKRKRTRKRKSGLKSDGENPNEHNGKPPEIDPTIPIGQTIPIDTATSKDQMTPIGQTIPIDPIAAPSIDPTIPIDPIAAPSIDPTIPIDQTIPIDSTIPMEAHPAIPISVAIPADPDHNTSEKKRKSDLKSEGENPNEHNGKPPEAPVQIPINPIAAPLIDPTIPIDQTIPIDPATSKDPGQRINPATSKDPGQPIDPATSKDPGQKMTDKKWKKKRMSALKSEGSESNQHNADPTAEAPAQGTKGVLVTRAPNICQACRKPGHKYTQCPRLKNLSKDEEICFFCGEIGHSLGKCSVSLAGGGRFAKCLFCHAHGHFTYNCPGNGQGIDPKVVAANGPINKSCA